MNKIKCIFLDIDNTLTDSNQNISQQTSDYFSKINKDCLIILVTGRNNIYAIEKSKTANASKIVIADNGAVIYDYGKNQVLYKNIFDKVLINLIWDISQAYNIDCVFNSIYKRYRNNKYMNSRFLGQHTIGINNPNEIEDDITQIVIHSNNEAEYKKCMEEIHQIEIIEVCNSGIESNGGYFADINIRGTSKGNAINKLFELFNIKKEESICFGDSRNDLSMFQSCGIKVAMKNGTDEIKQQADYITEFSNDENGVIEFLNQLLSNT